MRLINKAAITLVAACFGAGTVQADLYVYPKNGQSADQTDKDKYECYNWAKKDTGFDPMAVPRTTSAAPGGQSKSLNEEYSNLIVDLATQRGSYRTLTDSQDMIVASTQNRLEAKRGVNLDEEMANLVLFHRSFEANARVIRTIDQMLDTVVNGMI